MSSEQAERTSTPPSPTWSTMSSSCQPSSAATRRSAARSTWRLPMKVVCLVERCTGLQSSGFRQSHTMPRAHGWRNSWPSTRVGTCGGVAPARIAAAALSASSSHDRTCDA
eukprot:3497623-Prymnesium_polylepis.2